MAKQFKFDGLVKQAEQQLKEAEKKIVNSEAFVKKSIVIKEEFKSFIPPLSGEEYARLEENIIADGCRDPLVVWKKGEEYILIDGHNRLAICIKNQIDFKIEIKEFEDEDQARDWMVNNQFGKRNVSEESKSYLRGIQYSREKQKSANLVNLKQFSEKDIVSLSGNTAERLAQMHKVSDKTIKRDEKYAEGINKLAGENKQLKWDVLNNKIAIPKNIVMDWAGQETDFVRAIGKLLEQGLDLKEAIQEAMGTKQEKNKVEISPKQEAILYIKTNIVTNLNTVIKKGDKKAFEELKNFIKELEKALFG